jgi:hypothetical protein
VAHRADVAFDGPSMVADLATTGFTLMRAGLQYVEAFTKLIVQNKPRRCSTLKMLRQSAIQR